MSATVHYIQLRILEIGASLIETIQTSIVFPDIFSYHLRRVDLFMFVVYILTLEIKVKTKKRSFLKQFFRLW